MERSGGKIFGRQSECPRHRTLAYTGDAAKTYHAFREKDAARILKLSAEIGHYIADAHVPCMRAVTITASWPTSAAYMVFGRAAYRNYWLKGIWFFRRERRHIDNPGSFIWSRVLENAGRPTVCSPWKRNWLRSFLPVKNMRLRSATGRSSGNIRPGLPGFNDNLNGMVERRMRQSILCRGLFLADGLGECQSARPVGFGRQAYGGSRQGGNESIEPCLAKQETHDRARWGGIRPEPGMPYLFHTFAA